jgi:hypothetical protein
VACQQVRFALADCVVEISPEFPAGSHKARAYTAFLSLVENGGSLVRPLVSSSGHRVRIRAASEPLALHSAISYLRARFGAVSHDSEPCSLGQATVGRPIAMED